MNTVAAQTMEVLKRYSYYPTPHVITGSSTQAYVVTDGRPMVNFGSNSYLGIANHPKVVEAAITALRTYGLGSGASRLTAGTLDVHRRLEEEIARFKKREAAIIFSSGTLANIGIITALAGYPLKGVTRVLEGKGVDYGDTEIFCDALNHASIQDGIRLASSLADAQNPCRVTFYRHREMSKVRHGLERYLSASTAASKLVITDGVFSLHGDLAPLPQLEKLCRHYGAQLYVDDAHGTGILGTCGRGTPEYFGVESGVDYLMGTFSKGLGGEGGFLVGSQDLCDYLRVAGRTYMFQTSMPGAVAAGLIAAIELIDEEPWRRHAVIANADYVRNRLQNNGLSTLTSETHIIPVLIGSECHVKGVEKALDEAGVFAPCYYYPSVPRGQAIVRLNMHAEHTREDLDLAINSLVRAINLRAPI